MPRGILTNQSVNCKDTVVGFSSPNPICLYTEYGNKLTLAPKSNSALSIEWSPMTQEIVGTPGSRNLGAV